jgi:acyl carrier protein
VTGGTGLVDSITAILRSIRPEFDFTTSQDFVQDGMLDSFDMVTLVSELQKHYRISIDGVDIVPNNFRSLAAIAELLRRSGADL